MSWCCVVKISAVCAARALMARFGNVVVTLCPILMPNHPLQRTCRKRPAAERSRYAFHMERGS